MTSTLKGFDFTNAFRNENLVRQHGLKVPTALKTGTTICGVVFKDGVVLGADTRATEGSIVADKNCEKIHFIAPNIYCCGAGTAADTENCTAMVSSELQLHRYATGKQSRVITSLTVLKRHLFKYQGHVSAALVLGGVDSTGPHLHTIYPHGSTDSLPFVSMGSGSLAAIAMLEKGFKDDLTEEEAKALVHSAISAGIYNDLGSGSNVDLCVIKNGKTEYIRGYDLSNQRKERRQYHIPKGTTIVTDEQVKFVKDTFATRIIVEDVMED